jgi:hypothetical protein
VVARAESGQIEVVADAGERSDRVCWELVEQIRWVAELLGQPASDLEVELRNVLTGDVAVHVLDLRLELGAVHERAGVELGQGFSVRDGVHAPTVTARRRVTP